jgi:hypothetical protein
MDPRQATRRAIEIEVYTVSYMMLNHSTCHEIVQNGNSIRVDARPNLKVLEKHTHPNSVPRMVD